MPRRLLIAEDSRTIRTLVHLVLALDDVELIDVEDGNEVVPQARACSPDLILLDVAIQGGDGYEVCKALKSDPALARIPVLFLAGERRECTEERWKGVGAQGVVIKPFKAQTFLEEIRGFLGAAPEVDEAEAPVAEEIPVFEEPAAPAAQAELSPTGGERAELEIEEEIPIDEIDEAIAESEAPTVGDTGIGTADRPPLSDEGIRWETDGADATVARDPSTLPIQGNDWEEASGAETIARKPEELQSYRQPPASPLSESAATPSVEREASPTQPVAEPVAPRPEAPAPPETVPAAPSAEGEGGREEAAESADFQELEAEIEQDLKDIGTGGYGDTDEIEIAVFSSEEIDPSEALSLEHLDSIIGDEETHDEAAVRQPTHTATPPSVASAPIIMSDEMESDLVERIEPKMAEAVEALIDRIEDRVARHVAEQAEKRMADPARLEAILQAAVEAKLQRLDEVLERRIPEVLAQVANERMTDAFSGFEAKLEEQLSSILEESKPLIQSQFENVLSGAVEQNLSALLQSAVQSLNLPERVDRKIAEQLKPLAAAVTPLTTEMIEKQVKKIAALLIKKVVMKTVPRMAEKAIRQETEVLKRELRKEL
ncbi:MAG: response regulator [Deltaproteobacteria bacterium]|nr:MAG: response regulator [Deltaproteobacteria bacterium]